MSPIEAKSPPLNAFTSFAGTLFLASLSLLPVTTLAASESDKEFGWGLGLGAAVWYSDWGYREAGKVHARLTYNPYFEWQAEVMAQVLEAAQPQENTH